MDQEDQELKVIFDNIDGWDRPGLHETRKYPKYLKGTSKETVNWTQDGREQYFSGICVSEENGTSARDNSMATKLAEGGASLREPFPSQLRVVGHTATQQVPEVHTGL